MCAKCKRLVAIVRIAKEDGETILADVLTKCLPGPQLRELLVFLRSVVNVHNGHGTDKQNVHV